MMRRSTALLVAIAVSAACAAAPPPPPPEPVLDLVGVYDYTADVQGMEMVGTMTITESDGEYSGSASTDMGTLLLRNFLVDGMEVTCVGESPDMSVLFLLMFEGDSFSGEWDADGMSGAISGTKR